MGQLEKFCFPALKTLTLLGMLDILDDHVVETLLNRVSSLSLVVGVAKLFSLLSSKEFNVLLTNSLRKSRAWG